MPSRADLKVVPADPSSALPASDEAPGDTPITQGDMDLMREVERLRRRIRQHEHTITHLTEALLALRRGGQALREENRELRHDLLARRRT